MAESSNHGVGLGGSSSVTKGVSVAVGVGVSLGGGVGLAVSVGLDVSVGQGVSVGVLVGSGVGVRKGVGVSVGVGVKVDVTVAVAGSNGSVGVADPGGAGVKIVIVGETGKAVPGAPRRRRPTGWVNIRPRQ